MRDVKCENVSNFTSQLSNLIFGRAPAFNHSSKASPAEDLSKAGSGYPLVPSYGRYRCYPSRAPIKSRDKKEKKSAKIRPIRVIRVPIM